jgi:hypothetical protein
VCRNTMPCRWLSHAHRLFFILVSTTCRVFLLRGNHETRDINGWEEHYGERSFIYQCRSRFGDDAGYRIWYVSSPCAQNVLESFGSLTVCLYLLLRNFTGRPATRPLIVCLCRPSLTRTFSVCTVEFPDPCRPALVRRASRTFWPSPRLLACK